MKVVCILSGGMDSTTAMYQMHNRGHKVTALTFDYGQRHAKEIGCARAVCRQLDVPHTVVNLSGITKLLGGSALTADVEVPEGHYAEENMRATVVPNRNMIMLGVAAANAIAIKADAVMFAAHAGDHAVYPDCRLEFVHAVETAINVGNYEHIAVIAPFIHYSKTQIVQIGLEEGVPYHLTWSCYKGEDVACGRCGTCTERLEAFHLAGIEDPIEYQDREYWKTVIK